MVSGRHVHKGDWSNGMTGVSKTLSGSSILSSPVLEKRNAFAFLFLFVIIAETSE